MSAGSVLQSVLAGIGIDHEHAEIGADDFEMRQIRELMNAAGRDISRRTAWPSLTGAHDLAVTWRDRGVVSVSLPELTWSVVSVHVMTSGGSQAARKVDDPALWAQLTGTGSRRRGQTLWHRSRERLELLGGGQRGSGTVRIHVTSRQWVAGGREQITQNGDRFLVPDRLVEKGTIWRWLRQKGLPYDDILAEAEADIAAEAARAG